MSACFSFPLEFPRNFRGFSGYGFPFTLSVVSVSFFCFCLLLLLLLLYAALRGGYGEGIGRLCLFLIRSPSLSRSPIAVFLTFPVVCYTFINIRLDSREDSKG